MSPCLVMRFVGFLQGKQRETTNWGAQINFRPTMYKHFVRLTMYMHWYIVLLPYRCARQISQTYPANMAVTWGLCLAQDFPHSRDWTGTQGSATLCDYALHRISLRVCFGKTIDLLFHSLIDAAYPLARDSTGRHQRRAALLKNYDRRSTEHG